ncbi:ATP-binding protein [Fredinandcohnia sp. QZ13]|uniref:ATP-binding protein n=1 Tax=Fredinandcohnia sp. QZ13 TaxID=3073144 RepID=UPI00285354E6|nr:ATP-binding protein [Fredinandcohnia sp. QZ13]MDR4886700.1 ATP-binding protein [Fredinandcohnia sp. QZ13]
MFKEVFKKRLWLIYFLASLFWITFSEYLLDKFPSVNANYFQIGKGLVFVFFTTLLIHLIIKKHDAYIKALEEQNELTTLINAMPDFVCFKDGQGRWIRVNRYAKDLYNLQTEKYKNKTDIEIAQMYPDFKEYLIQNIQLDEETWERARETRYEQTIMIPSGELKTFDVIRVPLFEVGKRAGLVTIGRDVSNVKAAEELARRREKLSVVGELAAGIAHEIRNPLTTIKGFVQLQKEKDESNSQISDIILSELDRINQIVSELLVFSKPQSKILKEFKVNDIIDYLIKLTSHEAILHNVEVRVENQVAEAILYGDKNELIQVFVNVIKNSIDAMPTGGKIRIRTWVNNDKVKIEVIDTGVGIPKERLEKIGEPFFTLKEKGMGLGLTMSNKIIQDHKGTFNIRSKVGLGTKVIITLPSSHP